MYFKFLLTYVYVHGSRKFVKYYNAACKWCAWLIRKVLSGLDDWIYWSLIHTTWNYRQYSTIAVLHTFQFTVAHALGFSVFTSRILAPDLSQSHCHFKSHVKSSLQSRIPFLPIFSQPPWTAISRTRPSSRSRSTTDSVVLFLYSYSDQLWNSTLIFPRHGPQG
jgi:hypothetical protein